MKWSVVSKAADKSRSIADESAACCIDALIDNKKELIQEKQRSI